MSEPDNEDAVGVTLAEEVRAAFRACSAPMDSMQVRERCPSRAALTEIGVVLWRLRKAGEITRDVNKKYRAVPGKLKENSRKPRGKDRPPAPNGIELDPPALPGLVLNVLPPLRQRGEPDPAAQKSAPAPEPKPATLPIDELVELLERNAKNAQDALDDYVWLVGNAQVLAYLMDQRDAARNQLMVHKEKLRT